ncbi:choice-of-anchor D domain-containing protein [Actinokineospora sp. HUAS TT18]|uniref:choice-of-anchor D domain-containing protein n=1 Tax=Actinokineospora sp. HUAS TT18 TaxID=3447451 RepID=UPI003F521FD4
MPVSPAHRACVVVLTAALSVVGYALFVGQADNATAAVAPGSTVRASLTDAGLESPQGGSEQQVSGDGRSVVFSSRSPLAQPADEQTRNVYVRDLVRGRTVLISRGQFTIPEPPTTTTPPPPTTEPPPPTIGLRSRPLLSFAAQQQPVPGETAADDDSFEPTISGDGRYVAFTSWAGNIVEVGESFQTLIGVDRDPDGDGEFDELKPNNEMDHRFFAISIPFQSAASQNPTGIQLSADGSRAVWQERAPVSAGFRYVGKTALLRSPGNGEIGTPFTAEFLATGLEGSPAVSAQTQEEPAISADGRFAVTTSSYTFPTGAAFQAIVRHELATGVNQRVDLDEDGQLVATADIEVFRPAISGDGSVISFVAQRDEDYQPNVYVVRPDVPDSELVSRDVAGNPVNGTMPALSADGRYVAFATDGFRVHDGQDGPVRDEFFSSCVLPQNDLNVTNRMLATVPPVVEDRDRRTACQVVIRDLVSDRERRAAELPRLPAALASVSSDEGCADDGVACGGNDDSPPSTGSASPSLTADGRTVAFSSAADDLISPDDNEFTDVFAHTFEPAITGDPVQFGTVTVGTSVSRTATVRHVGFGPLPVEEVTITGAGAGDYVLGAGTCVGTVLHQGGTCLASVRFTPSQDGNRPATLRVKVRGNRLFTIDLIGTGGEAPPGGAELSAGPDPADFGPRLLLSTGPGVPVTVRNTGGSPMTVSAVDLASPDFAAGGCVGATVPAGGSCVITVTYSPQGPALPADRSAVLRITSTAPGGPHLVGVRGQVVQPVLDVNPGVIAPGRVTTATGIGFPPGRTVTLSFTTAVGGATAVTDSTGRFSAQLLVFPKASVGQRTVVATVDGATPVIAADKPLLIVINTVSPAEFVGRG